MCPECGSNNIGLRSYDYGICSETGYRDAGEYFCCNDCGATGDVSEVESDGHLADPDGVLRESDASEKMSGHFLPECGTSFRSGKIAHLSTAER